MKRHEPSIVWQEATEENKPKQGQVLLLAIIPGRGRAHSLGRFENGGFQTNYNNPPYPWEMLLEKSSITHFAQLTTIYEQTK